MWQRHALSFDDWHADELARLIQTLAGRLQRSRPMVGTLLGHEQMIGLYSDNLLTVWIKTLAARDDDEAVGALGKLASDPSLKMWKPEIAQAQEAQATKRRVAKHKQEVLSLTQIQETLRGGSPANAADLAALVLDYLGTAGGAHPE